jgi:hypothetical protein
VFEAFASEAEWRLGDRLAGAMTEGRLRGFRPHRHRRPDPSGKDIRMTWLSPA